MPLPESFAELKARGGVMVYLPRHRSRAEYSLAKLSALGFANIVLTEGVDAYSADARKIAASEGLPFRLDLTPGEIGCALAMVRLWRRVVDQGHPYLLIFEDDVLPRPDLGSLGPNYWAETPRDVDFVFLGNRMTVDGSEMFFAPDDADRLVVRGLSWTTHAYIITLAGAHRALELLASPEVRERGIDGVDSQIRHWMEQNRIRWACWNGTKLPKVFPTSFEIGHTFSGEPYDVAWSGRDTGLFYQNFMLGSIVHDPEAVWRGLEDGAPR
jgi:hypothetical protein